MIGPLMNYSRVFNDIDISFCIAQGEYDNEENDEDDQETIAVGDSSFEAGYCACCGEKWTGGLSINLSLPFTDDVLTLYCAFCIEKMYRILSEQVQKKFFGYDEIDDNRIGIR